ncbi:MAG TPA: pyridoxamine 5'-phosphate oxidase family protein [Steroidobacteraceae bacterium]|nr:pyridoxamine 5'-phosphate oxidase family protein [Steroidobacteraceae bacterium]HRX90357.1 pyridoxamine 5'-phosphate oxidase family protein [Steroidobacteraceae bacterium]
MGKTFATIDADLAGWITAQPLFFVATAPLSGNGHVNCSPKGGDTLRVLGPLEVAYVDGAGSGIETVAHLRENGRLVLMFCAFHGAPRIVRLHGVGSVIVAGDADYEQLVAQLPAAPTVRSVIRLQVTRVSDSCGYGVPKMQLVENRTDSQNYMLKTSDKAMRQYLVKNNRLSIDRLPGMSEAELERVSIRRDR